MATIPKQAEKVNKIIELKKQGIAQSDIAHMFRNMNMQPPSTVDSIAIFGTSSM